LGEVYGTPLPHNGKNVRRRRDVDHYIIRVGGRLPDDTMAAFSGLKVVAEPVQTVLDGLLPDQAALAGALDYLDEAGVVIIEVLKLPSEDG
jgi:hypothetical protein